MKWPDGIGRGSWDWENPRQESANEKSGIARTDLPYHWVSPCGWKRVGPSEIIVVVAVVAAVELLCSYIIIVATPNATPPLSLQCGHVFFIFLLSLQPGRRPENDLLQQQNSRRRRSLSRTYKAHGFRAGLPEMFHFPMDFNNFSLRQISSILHRSARSTFPLVARTCRFCGAQNDTQFRMNFNISIFAAV